MISKKQQKAYGLWSSPISARMLSQGIRLTEVFWDSDGKTLVWYEGRSANGVLVAAGQGEPGIDLNVEISSRGGVGYGGGEFGIRDGVVIFCGKDGRLYRRPLGFAQPHPITPAFGSVAAPQISPDGEWVVYVYSDGNLDVLAVVDAQGKHWPQKLVSGADFYMQPVWHPGGKQLAWVEWNHPQMPWDGTRLMLADVRMEGMPKVENVRLIAGDTDTVIFQPEFSPDGKWLSYITSAGEWDAFVLVDLQSGEKRRLLNPQGAHLYEPAWVQGVRTYAWNADSQKIYIIQNEAGFNSLWQMDVLSGAVTGIAVDGYTNLKQPVVSSSGELALIATSAQVTPRVVVWNGDTWRVAARSSAEDIAPEYLSKPQPVEWQAADGVTVYGLYYSPANPDFAADGQPPVILHIHGGPTSQATAKYGAEISYFTSRGYGWLAVNYRGSTGYGHSYKKMLRQRWGDVDVEDAVSGARALVSRGLANEKQMIILGGSAGGYTVLNSLIRYPRVFKAGVCLYGVANLFTIDQDSHKFEAFYNVSLVGSLPEAAGRYHAWSPVFHAEHIRDALAIFQGDEDNVVPPSQSEEIVAKLRQAGIAHLYQLYTGEGHGFRKSETLLDYYERVEKFLQQNVLFAP
ncbi:MAG: hypothetical protein CVU39_13240 [Chloroflexi bacterium HGW-Chloroflexi-10]|nr:MAG: hypothetical protein CVU39_13240 [Chloroflexi bacterium HGW-Chloroflexi-10]